MNASLQQVDCRPRRGVPLCRHCWRNQVSMQRKCPPIQTDPVGLPHTSVQLDLRIEIIGKSRRKAAGKLLPDLQPIFISVPVGLVGRSGCPPNTASSHYLVLSISVPLSNASTTVHRLEGWNSTAGFWSWEPGRRRAFRWWRFVCKSNFR